MSLKKTARCRRVVMKRHPIRNSTGLCVLMVRQELMCRRTHTVLNQGRSQGFTLGAQVGTRIEAPSGGGWGRAPSANAFLAYLRPTELVVERTVPTKPGFFRKKIHSIDDWGRGHTGHGSLSPLATPLC